MNFLCQSSLKIELPDFLPLCCRSKGAPLESYVLWTLLCLLSVLCFPRSTESAASRNYNYERSFAAKPVGFCVCTKVFRVAD